jgi:hypothetical protein
MNMAWTSNAVFSGYCLYVLYVQNSSNVYAGIENFVEFYLDTSGSHTKYRLCINA